MAEELAVVHGWAIHGVADRLAPRALRARGDGGGRRVQQGRQGAPDGEYVACGRGARPVRGQGPGEQQRGDDADDVKELAPDVAPGGQFGEHRAGGSCNCETWTSDFYPYPKTTITKAHHDAISNRSDTI